ncbi:electron transfer flavoprotein alpha subunit [Fonticula alba]|uniref:Electron transfer flavoprotein subunit alpha n=1 Tax=Fonticula alba TaxID=691883 RepID=A0A058ZB72_FONAL|nr:electron transfer flavoprotein alpha subunit [Fonticula alba]KCV71181.1 electron transfer flavoprotein alpha subunit [Fonticula alba]|eukprot:XP_009494304.1 electron transfer flavoprotein alpha subunit [Fonticula alba]
MAARNFASAAPKNAVLVVAEHDGDKLNPSTLSAITAASKLNRPISLLVAGSKADAIAQEAAKTAGVAEVLSVKDAAYDNALAENVASLIVDVQNRHTFSHIFAPHSSFGRNVMPRAAALLDIAQISDITAVKDEATFVRPIYAGNAISTVKSNDAVRVVTVRSTAFEKADTTGGNATIKEEAAAATSDKAKFVGREMAVSDRPSLGTAARVVSGGRALKSRENFQIIYDLADAMGAAVGASRAAVDAGYCDNSLQIGQTGQIVAPQLYLAVGISGAIQHVAGMKDSKIIACINKNPEEPIFALADYGLEADLFEAVPEMIKQLKN